MYNLGDEFNLSGTAMILPYDVPVCLIFANDIINHFDRKNFKEKETLTCTGCTGKIRLICRRELIGKPLAEKKSESELSAIANLLGKFEIFDCMKKEDARNMISFLRLKKFYRGDIVIKKGDPGRYLFIMASGRVEVLEDNEVSITFLGPGEVFGEMSLLSGDAVTATIRVVEPSQILYIKSKDFKQFLYQYPSLHIYFARLLSRRLADTNVARAEEFSSGIIGKLSEMSATEVFQTLHTNQKTGVLIFELIKGSARFTFREGMLIKAQYLRMEGIDAFFEVLRENEGLFKFLPGLSKEDETAKPLGDFMWLLMEGVRRLDED